MVLPFVSRVKASDTVCPFCSGKVYVQENDSLLLKDYPVFAGIRQKIQVFLHRFQCTECGSAFTEDLGLLRYPGTRITCRAAGNIRQLLKYSIPISAISAFTGIRWNTIAKIHKEYMDEALSGREEELRKRNYKPKRLAVDEFAVHKGHTYATCVMDLDEGDILWVGAGRSKACFG
ncbi:MAG: transposase [Clostridia bacterium]|nr:transposase [Clostridia bacterium]